MKGQFILGAFAAIAMLASCNKKDNNNTPGGSAGIDGSYKFKYITATTSSTNTVANEKDVTTSNYTTSNNSGTMVFSNGTLTSNAVTYSADFSSLTYEYEDNVLVDSVAFPYNETYPPTNETGTYKLIGSDSIYFNSGSTPGSEPSGGKYSWNGNLLSIVQNFAKDTSFSQGGVIYRQQESAKSTLVLEKQ